ncbi:helix-turn-helix transcriptional regulator [Enterococcus sp. AZ109]|uniref:helix-turn-helix transcriptional regulator n=1 Tax=Enterococcus sp. AZ109 TaxID=2774634 RepID=UPI003F206879
MKVINHIKEIREARGIPQNTMAKAVGVSRQTMTAIEKGKYNPSLELSLKIAGYFELPFEEIFYLEGKET